MGLSEYNRDPHAPFFLDPDGVRPLLYGKAMAQLKQRLARVGVQPNDMPGLHGLRVEGYNATEAVFGEDLASAHGIWKSKAHKRYKRFALTMVAQIPSAIAGYVEPPELEDERAAGPPSRRLTRAALSTPVEAAAVAGTSEGGLPEGWVYHEGLYQAPDGRVAESCVAAWRVACEDDAELAHDVDAAAGLAVLAGAQERDVALAVSSRAQAQGQVRSPTPTRARRSRTARPA